jgi:hypothetical protein
LKASVPGSLVTTILARTKFRIAESTNAPASKYVAIDVRCSYSSAVPLAASAASTRSRSRIWLRNNRASGFPIQAETRIASARAAGIEASFTANHSGGMSSRRKPPVRSTLTTPITGEALTLRVRTNSYSAYPMGKARASSSALSGPRLSSPLNRVRITTGMIMVRIRLIMRILWDRSRFTFPDDGQGLEQTVQ